MNTPEIKSLIFIFLIFLIPVLIAAYLAQSKQKNKPLLRFSPLVLYLVGAGLFLGYLWSFFSYESRIVAMFPSRPDTIGQILIFLIPVFILVPIMHKISKYLSMGFIMGPPTVILFFAMFIIEFTIHPPDEE